MWLFRGLKDRLTSKKRTLAQKYLRSSTTDTVVGRSLKAASPYLQKRLDVSEDELA